MRAFVTGANGFLGSHLTRRLLERGHFVRCLIRPGGDAAPLSGLAVELVHADVTDGAALRPAVAGIEVVFHLAGIRRTPTRDTFFRVNALGTRNVCEAMATAGEGKKRLVLCSSLAASGPSSPSRPKREDDPFAPEEWYGESKAEAERIAFSYADRLEVAVARPARIIGPGDRENAVFFRMVNKGLRLKIGGGERPLSTIDVSDAVELLLLLAEKPEAVGQAFFAASTETTTLEHLQDAIANALGVSPRTLFLPAPLLKGLGAAADVASKVSGRHLPLNRKLARQLLAPAWTCSMDKALRLLGYRPATPLADSIRRSADWYRHQGWL
ncbi:MAG: NAD-dependent epimerase/dehydratase family protein [Myxococcales bacterium]|nr:NAD-dependent epimerase/dehydratase family protein [Myxococcales bacterium]